MARINQANGMLTARQVARLLNVHINTVRRWDGKGVLKAHRIGPRGDRRFSRENIALFLAESSRLEA
ncbi:MAG: helix-turn-helix domain-containing protein [Chloroflexi bacterium]|nr:helix-turn-helix domain-containing protein [Chloroflexota bacterium]